MTSAHVDARSRARARARRRVVAMSVDDARGRGREKPLEANGKTLNTRWRDERDEDEDDSTREDGACVAVADDVGAVDANDDVDVFDASAATAAEDALIEARRRRRAEILAKHGARAGGERGDAGKRARDDTVEERAMKSARATTATTEKRAKETSEGPMRKKERAAPAGDMFGEDSDEEAFYLRDASGEGEGGDGAKVTGGAVDMSKGLTDNWDDAEGYYCARIGEVLDGRYTITAHLGKGVFSNVLRAVDKREGEMEVAIKVIRCNETMHKAAQLEIDILQKLSGSDPENKRHCVRFLRHFEYREHVFMVFESLSMNLREVIKKFGRNVGINIRAVQAYATQLFIALRHLKNCGVVHADIKPDNILVNETKSVLKVCDFGSAMFDGDNELTPYLVSRFYRAPEVILGLPYSHPMDLWSVGCCLYELFTGSIAFPGRSNNHMLKLMLELKGPVPQKVLRRALFTENHYDHTGAFAVIEEDPVTKKSIRRLIRDAKPTKDLTKICTRDGGMSADERKKALQLADLLNQIFNLDSEKRITVGEALQHPFVVERIPPASRARVGDE